MSHNHMMIYLYSLLKSQVNRLQVIKISVCLILMLTVMAGAANAAASKADKAEKARQTLTATMRTDYFIVHYDPQKKLLSQSLADTAHDELLRISQNLNYHPESEKPFQLYIYPSHSNFIKAGGLEGTEFTVGTASSGSDTISVDASRSFALPEQVIAHEVTHAVIFRILGPNISKLPLWMNEGLAKYESDDFRDDDKALITDTASQGMLIPLHQLNRSFPRNKTALAYAESASAVYYLIDGYGKSAPRKILQELATSGSFDGAMVEVTGKSGSQFQDDWYNHSMKRHWFVRVTQIGLQVVSALMAILAVMAFIARRKKKIQAAKEWEWEQFNESMRKQLDDGSR